LKKIAILFFTLLLLTFNSNATALNKGDIIVIGFNVTNNSQNWVTFLARTTIPAGTVLTVTNDLLTGYSSGNATFTAGSAGTRKLQITLTEDLLAGQTFKVFKNGSLTYSSHGNSVATGTIDIDNSNDIRVLWVYQEFNGSKNLVTGVAWNWGSGNGNEVDDIHTAASSSGVVWTHESNANAQINTSANALNLNVNGSSSKCGSWNPFLPNSTSYRPEINLSTNITSSGSFYNVGSWAFGNSNGWNTCNLSEVDANVVNGYLAVNLVRSDVYKKTCSGWFYSTNGGTTFSPDLNTTIWPSNAATAEVRIECDHTLSGTNYDTYTCFKLVIGNSSNANAVTLTVDPGNNILFTQSLVFNQSSNGARPTLKLRSGENSNIVRYAAILPSSAPLNDLDGDISYEFYIKYPGWHHLQSPISSTFSNVAVRTNVTSGSPVSINGSTFFTSNAARFWSWDNSAQQWVNEVSNVSTADFSAEPYTIYVTDQEVPLTFTVTGLIPASLRDQTYYTNINASSSTFAGGSNNNVPWVKNNATLQGNNFYGNPFPTFIDSRELLSNYMSTSGKSSNNQMTNLNDYLLIWDPSLGTSAGSYNVSNQYQDLSCSYSSNTYTYTSSSTKTYYLSPFQAFMMKSPASGPNGFAVSRRYRIGSSANTTSNTVVNKSKTITDQKTLYIFGVSNNLMSQVNVGAYFNTDRQYKEHSDVRAHQSGTDYFGAYVDSMLLSSIFWPTQYDTASINLLFSSQEQSGIYKLQTNNHEGYIFDRRNKTLHNLSDGEYYFAHDSLWNNVSRFKWLFNQQAALGNDELASQSTITIFNGNGQVHFMAQIDGEGQIFNSTGQLVKAVKFTDGYATIPSQDLVNGIYFISLQGASSKFIVQ
jgi:hypothetical protein